MASRLSIVENDVRTHGETLREHKHVLFGSLAEPGLIADTRVLKNAERERQRSRRLQLGVLVALVVNGFLLLVELLIRAATGLQ